MIIQLSIQNYNKKDKNNQIRARRARNPRILIFQNIPQFVQIYDFAIFTMQKVNKSSPIWTQNALVRVIHDFTRKISKLANFVNFSTFRCSSPKMLNFRDFSNLSPIFRISGRIFDPESAITKLHSSSS